MFRYVLPGTIAPLTVATSLRMASVLLSASALSFPRARRPAADAGVGRDARRRPRLHVQHAARRGDPRHRDHARRGRLQSARRWPARCARPEDAALIVQPILTVRGLRIEFCVGGQGQPRGGRHRSRRPGRRDRRPRRRDRLRKVGHRPLDPRPHPVAAREGHRRAATLRRQRAPRSRRRRAPPDPRRRDLDDLPGADDRARSVVHRRQPGRGGPAGPPRARRDRAGARVARGARTGADAASPSACSVSTASS